MGRRASPRIRILSPSAKRVAHREHLPGVVHDKRVRPQSLTTSPETGFGSEARNQYFRDALERERQRRDTSSPEQRDRLLIAPNNDVSVNLVRVFPR